MSIHLHEAKNDVSYSRVLIAPKARISSMRSVVYHQHGVLHLIKPQEKARWRVMRYKGGTPPLMIYTAPCAVMICQACGLDKQKQNICLLTDVLLLLVETIGIEPMTSCMSSKRSNHLGYASGDGVYYIIRFWKLQGVWLIFFKIFFGIFFDFLFYSLLC